mgnify:FL=1
MTDLETAILDVLRHAQPDAMTLTDVHAELVRRGWAVHEIPPLYITRALIALTNAGWIRNEQSWRALADAPTIPLP